MAIARDWVPFEYGAGEFGRVNAKRVGVDAEPLFVPRRAAVKKHRAPRYYGRVPAANPILDVLRTAIIGGVVGVLLLALVSIAACAIVLTSVEKPSDTQHVAPKAPGTCVMFCDGK
jgi:hypothetical protein